MKTPFLYTSTLIVASIFCTSLQAQNSGGGSGGIQVPPWPAWPANVPRPSDIPPERAIVDSTLVITGSLDEGMTALYTVPGSGAVSYFFYEKYTWGSDGSLYSERNHIRTSRKWLNGSLVNRSMRGFVVTRLGLNLFTPPSTEIKDHVNEVMIDFTLEVNAAGVIEAQPCFRSRSASVITKTSPSESRKLILSSIAGGPSFLFPTEQRYSGSFVIDLKQTFDVGWTLTRKYWAIRPLEEEGTYPNSGNPNGSVSIEDYTIWDPPYAFRHIVDVNLLTPSLENRNIYIYQNFSDTVPWTFSPWISF